MPGVRLSPPVFRNQGESRRKIRNSHEKDSGSVEQEAGNMTFNEELKPCPFCGSKLDEMDIMQHSFFNAPPCFGVVCYECQSRSSQLFDTKEEAVEAWNKRVGENNE